MASIPGRKKKKGKKEAGQQLGQGQWKKQEGTVMHTDVTYFFGKSGSPYSSLYSCTTSLHAESPPPKTLISHGARDWVQTSTSPDEISFWVQVILELLGKDLGFAFKPGCASEGSSCFEFWPVNTGPSSNEQQRVRKHRKPASNQWNHNDMGVYGFIFRRQWSAASAESNIITNIDWIWNATSGMKYFKHKKDWADSSQAVCM